MRDAERSHEHVRHGRYDQSCGHETLDVAVVCDESVHELPDGVCEQEGRADHPDLRGVERAAVEDGFLHDVERRPAHVIETVSERCGDECLQPEPFV